MLLFSHQVKNLESTGITAKGNEEPDEAAAIPWAEQAGEPV